MLKEFANKERLNIGAFTLLAVSENECTYEKFKACQLALYVQYMIKNINSLTYFDFERVIRLMQECAKDSREELLKKFNEGYEKYGLVQYLEDIYSVEDPNTHDKKQGIKSVLEELMFAMLRHCKRFIESNSIDDKMGVLTNALMIIQIILIHKS